MLNNLFSQKVKVINVGIPSFAEDLKSQGIEVVHINWSPPAGGNPKILKLLEKIKKNVIL